MTSINLATDIVRIHPPPGGFAEVLSYISLSGRDKHRGAVDASIQIVVPECAPERVLGANRQLEKPIKSLLSLRPTDELTYAMTAPTTPVVPLNYSPYQNSVLRVETAVSVTLARQSVSLQKVLGLVPGSMLVFDKHYADPLQLEANGLPIAIGETVKVGDKFGIRILQIVEPAKD